MRGALRTWAILVIMVALPAAAPPAPVRDCAECPPMRPIAPPAGSPLKPFYIGVYELTWREYMSAVREVHCKLPTNGVRTAIEFAGPPPEDDYPVTGIPRDDFDCYLGWLSRKTGKRYRLPTNAEWDLVSSPLVTQLPIPWSTPPADDANSPEAKRREPRNSVRMGAVRRVGQDRPNGYGLYDLEGNASEVVQGEKAGTIPHLCRRFGASFCRGIPVRGETATEHPETTLRNVGYWVAGLLGYDVGFRLARDAD